jgi:hypothetical protein
VLPFAVFVFGLGLGWVRCLAGLGLVLVAELCELPFELLGEVLSPGVFLPEQFGLGPSLDALLLLALNDSLRLPELSLDLMQPDLKGVVLDCGLVERTL